MRAPTRRELIAGATAGAFTAAVDPAWGSLLSRRAAVGPGRFRDGVATGDPTPTAVTVSPAASTHQAGLTSMSMSTCASSTRRASTPLVSM